MPQEPQQYSNNELLEIFPESKQIVPALIKELEQKRAKLLSAIIKQNASINAESTDVTYRYFWKSWFIQPLREERRVIDQNLARLYRQLRIIKGIPIPPGALTNDVIQAAKAIPLESLFTQKFRRTGQMLVGLCPFQTERTPSFHIYTKGNRCWCFGCNQGGNVIDTYIKLHDCGFKDAVLALMGGLK